MTHRSQVGGRWQRGRPPGRKETLRTCSPVRMEWDIMRHYFLCYFNLWLMHKSHFHIFLYMKVIFREFVRRNLSSVFPQNHKTENVKNLVCAYRFMVFSYIPFIPSNPSEAESTFSCFIWVYYACTLLKSLWYKNHNNFIQMVTFWWSF